MVKSHRAERMLVACAPAGLQPAANVALLLGGAKKIGNMPVWRTDLEVYVPACSANEKRLREIFIGVLPV